MSRVLLRRVGMVAAATALLTLPVIAASPASADTITVTTTTDGGSGSLRDAIDQVNADPGTHTIVLAAGATYDLTICAEDEQDVDDDDNSGGDLDIAEGIITIQGNGSTVNQTCRDERVIDYFAYEDDGLTLQDLTVTGGNTPAYGGGVHVDGGVALDGVTITGNQASEYGGGLAADSGYDVTVTDSVISGNSTDGNGGGIEADFSTFTMTRSTVSGNDAANDGGGIAAYNDVDSATGDPVVITQSTISGNTATDSGGGLHIESPLEMTNSTVTGNDAEFAGGIYAEDGEVTLTYLTVVSNTAGDAANIGSELGMTVFGTVVADPLGTDVSCAYEDSPVSLGYNYEQGGDTCVFDEDTDTADGADPELGALAPNGGTTETMLPADSSPLVDAIPLDDPECTGTDQRDVTRPQFDGCDIGAVEVEEPAPIDTTTTTSTTAPPAAAAVVTPRFTG